ncbi:MAG: UDP-glucose 4-epimerase GalE [Kordiimonadaceae bacterium]|nr:UDP-glucose 4-epimerase GalE [Kordiimonadaceae bacterium]MBT6035354.1 UDP-glucose 4-epimerase GalE [Kordiimonadaceae bacterium]MBT6330362.1 UDP-glucose 4-epimerase GalE [Kordiimonadaceae bacterium]
MMNILVTGGCGYIGSHTVLALLEAGHKVTIIDNLCNSSREVLERIKNITGINELTFVEMDIRDADGLEIVFNHYKFDAVMHFAGLKSVGESTKKPLEYYDNNVGGTAILLNVMKHANVKTLVFSSSATVYGDPISVPISETAPTGGTTNPYGTTKLMIEQMLSDLYASDQSWNIARLRYFNPVGAHESGLIGEDPGGIPNNLMPYITQVASGKLDELSVYGDDYDTADGSGVRDYIHVVDLAAGHLKALDKLEGLATYNLGTGKGYSVLDVIKAFEDVNDIKISYKIAPRREGDIASCYADPTLAESELGWKANKDINQMVRDAWNWQSKNPTGY